MLNKLFAIFILAVDLQIINKFIYIFYTIYINIT